jgi:hypothetical protein
MENILSFCLFIKVLELLWTISYDKHLPNEIIDQALAGHLKILDYSCLPVRISSYD